MSDLKDYFSRHKVAIIVLIIIILLILSAIAVLLYRYYHNNSNSKSVTSKTPTTTQNSAATPGSTQSNQTKTPTSSSKSTTSSDSSTPSGGSTTPFTVTNATVVADATCADYSLQAYPYSQTFHITGTITATAAGTVTYKWQPNPTYITTTQSLTFTGPGTKAVNPSTITLTIPNWQVDYVYGSMWLKVFTPNVVSSNTVNLTLDNDPNGIHPCP